MKLSAIAAMSTNGVIGRDGKLPWHLPRDLARFRKLTMGHAVIMGRKTCESLRAPLEGRGNYVLTKDGAFRRNGFQASRPRTILECLEAFNSQVFVIGGAEVYGLLLHRCTTLHLTIVDAWIDGDTSFPVDMLHNGWRVVATERHEADEFNAHATTHYTLERTS